MYVICLILDFMNENRMKPTILFHFVCEFEVIKQTLHFIKGKNILNGKKFNSCN